jgi:hypothetical protein
MVTPCSAHSSGFRDLTATNFNAELRDFSKVYEVCDLLHTPRQMVQSRPNWATAAVLLVLYAATAAAAPLLVSEKTVSISSNLIAVCIFLHYQLALSAKSNAQHQLTRCLNFSSPLLRPRLSSVLMRPSLTGSVWMQS